jgi:methionine salvage enolase-phosphatase E1
LKTPDDSKKAPSEANMSAAMEGTVSPIIPVTKECLNKCYKTTAQNKRLIKKTFDINSDQMNDNLPKSARKNTPFENTVTDHWKKTHPDMEMLQGVVWLKGFWGRAQKDGLIREDWDYLVELKKWHKKQDRDLDMGENESATSTP